MTRYSLAFVTAGAMLAPAAAFAAGPDIFKANGCTKCHSITGQGIQRDAAHDDEAKDLSTVGSRHDKKWIAMFLLKKVDRDGEKHKKTFQGTTPDLKVLAEWLDSLK